jgi:histidinol-phosphate/aromatic aminotransferase/cobyric acid decarboxylase-like protein
MTADALHADQLLRRSVIGVGPYVPGAGARELKARTGRTDLIRLNWNENMLGPLEGVLDAVATPLGRIPRRPMRSSGWPWRGGPAPLRRR